MPELPEVEAAKRSLARRVVGEIIASVDVRTPAVVRTPRAPLFARRLVGKRIARVSRRGKALLLDLSGGSTLVFHFKLWGTVRFARLAVAPDAQTAVVMSFQDNSTLQFRELQLSELRLYPTKDLARFPYLASLGVEPLSAAFTRTRWHTLVAGRGAIRALLTDQTRIAGIGNLWAHEILHSARIRPDRPAASLTAREADLLFAAIHRVLRRAVRAGGEPEFIDAVGHKGRWRLAVYGRGGQQCPRGDGTIRTTRLGGRPSFYCPACQR